MEEDKLIEEVSKYRFLYDKAHPRYGHKPYAKQAWKVIASEANCQVDEAKKKWSNLRDYFRRQLKEEHDNPKRKKWILFDKLSFLIPFMRLMEETEAVTDQESTQYVNMESPSSDSNDARHDKQRQGSNGNITSSMPVPLYLTKATPNPVPRPQSKTSSDIKEEATGTSSSLSHQNKPLVRLSDFTLAPTHTGMKRKLEEDDVNISEQNKKKCIDDDDQFFKSCAPMVKMLSPVQKLEFRINVQQLLLKFIKENNSSEADALSSSHQH